MLQKVLIASGVVAAILAALVFSGRLPGSSASKETVTGTVVLWGVFPEAAMATIIQPFNAQAKTYRITYKYVDPDEFEHTLVEALASGVGPDAILAPYQIILSQQSRIYPYPSTSMPEKVYKDTFLDGASIFWNPAGALALPVAIEPMVLFYNRALLSKHGVLSPPAYWDEVSNVTPNLTLMSGKSTFLESAIALGTYTVPYMKDILMTVVSQLGQTPVLFQGYSSDGKPVFSVLANEPTPGGSVRPLESAVRFFMSFSNPLEATYTWNQFSGDPSDAFTAEQLAMYIGYAGDLGVFKARNPKLDVEMTYLPQTRGYNTFVTGMRLYGIAVMRQTKVPSTAFTVASTLANDGWAVSLAGVVGATPASRAFLLNPGMLEVVQKSLLVARGWYDSNTLQTDTYAITMFVDILSGKQGIVEAVQSFSSRMYDLYN